MSLFEHSSDEFHFIPALTNRGAAILRYGGDVRRFQGWARRFAVLTRYRARREKLDSFVRGLGEPISMRAIRAAMTTVSTSWAAADHSRIARTLKITASIVVTTTVVAIASFVAVALSLT